MNDYQFFIKTVIDILKEEAKEAKHDSDKEKKDKNNSEFYQGYRAGYYRVFSLLQAEANAWNIPLSELSLDDIDPDKDLL